MSVEIQFDNTSTYECSSYSVSAWWQCSITRLLPHSEILDPPLRLMVGLALNEQKYLC